MPTPKGIKNFEPKAATLIGPQAINVHCTRAAPGSITRDGTTFRLTPRGTISILTAGQSLQLFFAEEWDPTLPTSESVRFKQQIAALQVALKNVDLERDKLARAMTDLSTLATSMRERIDVEAQGTRYILALNCPSGWSSLGDIGLIMLKKHYGNNPFSAGGEYNDGWQWTHPRLCKKD